MKFGDQDGEGQGFGEQTYSVYLEKCKEFQEHQPGRPGGLVMIMMMPAATVYGVITTGLQPLGRALHKRPQISSSKQHGAFNNNSNLWPLFSATSTS